MAGDGPKELSFPLVPESYNPGSRLMRCHDTTKGAQLPIQSNPAPSPGEGPACPAQHRGLRAGHAAFHSMTQALLQALLPGFKWSSFREVEVKG